METYRRIHGPWEGCICYAFLQDLYGKAYPRIRPGCKEEDCSIEELTIREKRMFFSSADVKKLLETEVSGERAAERMLNCSCDRCETLRQGKRRGANDRADMVLKVYSRKGGPPGRQTVLAALVYLGFAHLIYDLVLREPTVDDNHSGIADWLNSNPEYKSKLPSGFERSYAAALYLFKAPMLMLQSAVHFPDGYRFPYLDDTAHASGSFGEVRKFNIPLDFIDQKVKDLESLKPAISQYKKALDDGLQVPVRAMFLSISFFHLV